jgi:hypothetical protein
MVAARIPANVTDPDRRGYLALLLGLDDAIGRVTGHLRESAADRGTLVFFLSDNGGSGRKPFLSYNTGRNAPFRGDKGQTYEGGIRVPFVVSWPGRLPAGATYDQPVSALDVLPTACAVAGVQPKSVVEGVNLLPFLTGDNRSAPHTSLAWRFGPQKALRQGAWKIVDARDFQTKSQTGWQLYNVAEDISESNDLSATYPEKKAELIRAWEQWDKLNVEPKWHCRITEAPTAPPADDPAKKLIGSGLYYRSAEFVRDNIAELERLPFDGVIIGRFWPFWGGTMDESAGSGFACRCGSTDVAGGPTALRNGAGLVRDRPSPRV